MSNLLYRKFEIFINFQISINIVLEMFHSETNGYIYMIKNLKRGTFHDIMCT